MAEIPRAEPPDRVRQDCPLAHELEPDHPDAPCRVGCNRRSGVRRVPGHSGALGANIRFPLKTRSRHGERPHRHPSVLSRAACVAISCCDEHARRTSALTRGAGVTAARLTPRTRQLVISLIVACAMFMQSLDSTVIATALPAIGRSIGESPLRLNMAITCYLLSLAVFIPISGWTADRFGARRVFSGAIVVFTLGSIACGFSHSLWMLVVARIVQGMGGAMMVPVGRLVLLKTVPRSELVRAMSYVSVPALVGPVIGPPLGGFIVTYGSWPWIFFINVPIGVLGVVLVRLFIDNIRETTVRPFDLPGFALTGIGLASFAYGFEMSGRGELPLSLVAGMLGLGGLCLTLYVRHARRVDHPIIDLALMRIPTYRMATIGGFIFRMGLGALPFLMPLMLQVGFGLDPLSSGDRKS